MRPPRRPWSPDDVRDLAADLEAVARRLSAARAAYRLRVLRRARLRLARGSW